MSRHAKRRGSALMMALIALLVLTVVAIGLAFLTSSEDRISGNDRLQKAGFYAAETGLRAGEALLNGGVMQTPATITAMLKTAPSAVPAGAVNPSPDTLDLHDGEYGSVLLTVGGTTYRDVKVPFATAGGPDQPYYTLYVRNNFEDPSHSATDDGDKVVNLVAVGYVPLPGGKRITKILEEQISANAVGTEGGPQKAGNSGGTGGV